MNKKNKKCNIIDKESAKGNIRKAEIIVDNIEQPRKYKNKLLKKKRKIKRISNINIDSVFILDFKNPQIYTEKLNDKNTIKLNQKQYDFLKEKANKAFNKNNEICHANDYFIEISSNRLEEIDIFLIIII